MREKCRFCQSTNLKSFIKRKARDLVECQDCGLVFVSPFPTKTEVKRIYSEKGYAEVNPGDKTKAGFYVNSQQIELKRAMFRKRIPLIKKFKSKGKLLDVGCALGTFLQEARKSGYQVYGVDITKFAEDYCHRQGLKQVFKGTLEEKKFPHSSFDVVTAFQILEHLWDPQTFIDEVQHVLRPKGIFVIFIPDRKSLTARLLGRHWFGYYHYQHLFIFEPKTLFNYLKKSGFEIVEWGREGHAWILIKLAIERVEHYYSNRILLKLTNLLKRLLDFIQLNRVPMVMGNMWLVAQKK